MVRMIALKPNTHDVSRLQTPGSKSDKHFSIGAFLSTYRGEELP